MQKSQTDAAALRQPREDALKRFGQLLYHWRVSNGWTQHTAYKWGFIALGSGKISRLERGRAGYPSPGTVFAMAVMNQRIATKDWGRVNDRALLDRLQRAKPIVDANGVPWAEREFWAASVGLQPFPPELEPPPEDEMPILDASQAAALCEQWRQQLAATVLEQQLSTWKEVQGVTQLIPAEHRDKLAQVLITAGAQYQPEELEPLWDDGWIPERALQEWRDGLLEAQSRGETQ